MSRVPVIEQRKSLAAQIPAAPELDAFSIRVMRLVSPTLHSPAVLDLPEAIAVAEASSSASLTVLGDTVLSSALKVSSTFGTVYVGEMFHCYVSVANVSSAPVRNVRVKIEMQTNSSRTSLMDNCSVSALPSPSGNPAASAPTADALSYGPGLNRDYIVKHAIAADGLHCLVVAVSFLDEHGKDKTLQKFFKFQVVPAVQIKLAIFGVEELVFAEARVTNVTPRAILVERIHFVPLQPYLVDDIEELAPPDAPSLSPVRPIDAAEPLSHLHLDASAAPALTRDVSGEVNDPMQSITNAIAVGSGRVLKPNETRSCVVRIRMRDPSSAENQAFMNLGQFQVQWRTGMTQIARVLSDLVGRPPTVPGVGVVSTGPVEVVLKYCPDHAVMEQPLQVQLEVRNLLQRRVPLRLHWRKEKMGPILPLHGTSVALGVLEPRGSVLVSATLMPLAPGIHKLSGIRITSPEAALKISVDIDNIHDVLVCKPSDDSVEACGDRTEH